MRRLFGILFVAADLVLLPTLGWSQDLSAIPRQIKKQPAYQSGQPKFAVLVFGPKAETRIWAVIDGDTLYLDRNGNGDLTEADERFDLEVTHFTKEIRDDAKTLKLIHLNGPNVGANKDNDKSPILSCEPRVTWFHLFHLVPTEGSYQENSWTKSSFDVTIFANGCNEFARSEFGDSPEEAAVVSFLGPKTFKHDHGDEPILRRGESNDLTVGIMQQGIHSKTVIDHNFVPENIHPVVEIECPSRFANRPPVRVRAELTHRC